MDEATEEWPALGARKVVVPAHVVFRAFPHETVLLNVRTGQYHSVDAIGARFLTALQDHDDLDGASRALAAAYEQPIERIRADLRTFTTDMAQRGLVVFAG